MKCKSTANAAIDGRLENAIVELLALQELLSADEVDTHLLSDFRDALNRVRNTAWAVQQFIVSQLSEQGPAGLTSFLASERVRAAFQLCRSLQQDLKREEIEFRKGQLVELYGVVAELREQLKDRI